MAQRYKRIWRGDGYEMGLWCCDHPEPGPHDPEVAPAHEVVLPTGGAFTREVRGRRHVADATRVLFADRGEVYRVAHPIPGGDRCTVLSVGERLMEEIAGATDALVADGQSGLGFAASVAPIGGRLYAAHRRLSRDVVRGAADELEVDARVYELIDATVRVARGPRVVRARPRSRRRHERAVERAIEAIHEGFRSRLTLAGLAGEARYSAFHFARLFRDHTGLTVYGYVNRMRLRSAMEAVLDGAPDLTTVALRHGFATHSHFTRAFRREYGRTPSAVRRSAR